MSEELRPRGEGLAKGIMALCPAPAFPAIPAIGLTGLIWALMRRGDGYKEYDGLSGSN